MSEDKNTEVEQAAIEPEAIEGATSSLPSSPPEPTSTLPPATRRTRTPRTP